MFCYLPSYFHVFTADDEFFTRRGIAVETVFETKSIGGA